MRRWTTDGRAEADTRVGSLALAALRWLCPRWLANLLLRWRL